MKAFSPAWGQAVAVTNAVAATAAVVLPKQCQGVTLTNTSATARVHVMLTPFLDEGLPPAGVAPTLTTGLPILPNSQIRITVGPGNKLLRTIATAADGQILINPGDGI